MKRLNTSAMLESLKNNTAQQTYHCDRCKDQGVYFVDGKAVVCECKLTDIRNERRALSGITPYLQKQTFSTFDFSYYDNEKSDNHGQTFRNRAEIIYKESVKFVQDIANGKIVDGMMFTGPVGSGKSFMAAAIANGLIDYDCKVKFVVMPDFLDEIRDSYRANAENSEKDLMTEIKHVPVLILDDLGAHNYTDFAVRTIYAILNYRMNYQLPTVVTTNLSREEIEKELGSRIFSRLVDSCRLFRLENTGDIRIEKRLRTLGKGETVAD